jgi:hypothetical protein
MSIIGRTDIIENRGRPDHRLPELREMIILITPILLRMSIATIDIQVDIMHGCGSHIQCMALHDNLIVVYLEYLMVMTVTCQNQLPIAACLFAGCRLLHLQCGILIDKTILHYPEVAITGIHCQTRTQEPINTGTAMQMFD